MKNIVLTGIVSIIIAVLALVWWRYVPLTDGEYVVQNDSIAWHMSVSNGVLTTRYIENKTTGEQLKVSGQDFAVRIGNAETTRYLPKNEHEKNRFKYIIENGITISPENCRAIRMIRGINTRKMCIYSPALHCNIYLEFYYEKEQPWLHRRILLQACNPDDNLAVDQASHISWTVAGNRNNMQRRGQPVFVNDKWFLALEHPGSSNYIENSTVVLKQFPGYQFTTTPLALQSMIIGTSAHKSITDQFFSYVNHIRRPTRSITLYNTWCDLRGDQLTSTNIVAAAQAIKNNVSQYNNPIHVITIDDGWQNPQSIWAADTHKYPAGLSNVFARVRSLGFKNGLWLPLSGYTLDIGWGEQHGFEPASTTYYCLTATNYHAALSQRIMHVLTNNDISFLKHDFNYFRCGKYQHGHFAGQRQSEEANIDQFISLLQKETVLQSNLFIAITSGIWPSPWWLQYADTIWMGGKDHDFCRKLPVTRGSVFEMNYRDKTLYDILVNTRTVFPLPAFMTHGIVDGRHTVYDVKEEDDEGWANYVMNYLGRGTMMRELYITPSNLTPLRWKILARGLNWAASLDPCMTTSRFFLGDPAQSELFGYTGRHMDRRYISLRNPALAPVTYSMADLLLTNGLVEIVYPWHEFRRSDRNDTVTIPGEMVLQAETYPLAALDRPVPVGVRATCQASSATVTEYAVYPAAATGTFEILSPVAIEAVAGGMLTAVRRHDTTWQVTLTGSVAATAVPRVTAVTVSSNGVLRCMVHLPPDTSGQVRFLDYTGTIPHECTINNLYPELDMLAGDGWRISTVQCMPGDNDVRLGFQSGGFEHKQVAIEGYALLETRLPAYQMTITHAPVPVGERYNKPEPLLQDRARTTVTLVPRSEVTVNAASAALSDSRAVQPGQLTAARSGELRMDIFDVDGGRYDRKYVSINGIQAGKLPVNPEPKSRWHTCSIPLTSAVLAGIQLDNSISIMDATGDSYKIRAISLVVTAADGTRLTTRERPAVFSSNLQWQYVEGGELPVDGTPVTTLSF